MSHPALIWRLCQRCQEPRRATAWDSPVLTLPSLEPCCSDSLGSQHQGKGQHNPRAVLTGSGRCLLPTRGMTWFPSTAVCTSVAPSCRLLGEQERGAISKPTSGPACLCPGGHRGPPRIPHCSPGAPGSVTRSRPTKRELQLSGTAGHSRILAAGGSTRTWGLGMDGGCSVTCALWDPTAGTAASLVMHPGAAQHSPSSQCLPLKPGLQSQW